MPLKWILSFNFLLIIASRAAFYVILSRHVLNKLIQVIMQKFQYITCRELILGAILYEGKNPCL